MTALVDHALRYAARGWSVFPCQPHGKRPLTRNGQDDATSLEDRIIKWWTDAPAANIGIATGPSRLVVLDIDGPQGWAAFAAYPQDPAVEGFTIPPTRTCVTGNGAHLYYHVPPGERARANTTGMDGWAGLDVRGNGYVIAPPSVHPTGHVYAWVAGHHDLEPAAAPGFLLHRDGTATLPPAWEPAQFTDRDTRYAIGAVNRAAATVTEAAEGARNTALNTAAFGLGQLIAGGELTRDTATDALTRAAAACGLPPREAGRTIRSGIRAGHQQPRTAPKGRGQENRPRDTAPRRVIG